MLIYGGGAAYSTLYNCTLGGNSAYYNVKGLYPVGTGGGVYYCTLYNCTLIGNEATYGGGAAGGTLYNCTLTRNVVSDGGGGVAGGTLYNCTIIGNSAYYNRAGEYRGRGGGAYGGTLYNCIVYYNTAWFAGSNYYGSDLNYSCTTPAPGGIGNITQDPRFVNAAAGDYHLWPNSPCINGGTNQDWMIGAKDLDGNPRIRGGQVDMGAYERMFSLMPDDWLMRYGLSLDGSDDFFDKDEDGMDNWREWRCETDPTNRWSLLKCIADNRMIMSTGIVVRWQSVAGKPYTLERSLNLISAPSFTAIASNIIGEAESTTYMDTTAVRRGPYFYRVGVE